MSWRLTPCDRCGAGTTVPRGGPGTGFPPSLCCGGTGHKLARVTDGDYGDIFGTSVLYAATCRPPTPPAASVPVEEVFPYARPVRAITLKGAL